MKDIKKWISIALAACFSFSLFGCDGGSSENSSDSDLTAVTDTRSISDQTFALSNVS